MYTFFFDYDLESKKYLFQKVKRNYFIEGHFELGHGRWKLYYYYLVSLFCVHTLNIGIYYYNSLPSSVNKTIPSVVHSLTLGNGGTDEWSFIVIFLTCTFSGNNKPGAILPLPTR